MGPLPKLQILSLFRLNPQKISDFNDLAKVVLAYNKGLKGVEETEYYQEIDIDPTKWNQIESQNFQIKWWISVRNSLSGASRNLQSLASEKNVQFTKKGINLGTATEHHLIFLFREEKRHKASSTAKKMTQTWEIFALTTNDANHVIRDVADYDFPLNLARSICEPKILNESKIPIGGNYLNVGGEYKKEHYIAYSSLESLNHIIKDFQSPIKTSCSLYQTKPFKQFVHENEKEVIDRVKLLVGRMYIRFQHKFSLQEHIQICHQISAILDPLLSKDAPDEAFAYFDHIRNIPKENKCLIANLETAMLKKVFQAIFAKQASSFEFYHHHYQDYVASIRYRLRVYNKKKPLSEWNIRPSVEEILEALKNHLQSKNIDQFPQFINGTKNLVFDFESPKRKQLLTCPLLNFFKGEVFFEEKQYFYLDGNWCHVEGEYYSFVQNEFLKQMRDVFLAHSEKGALPLAWVSNKEWKTFSLDDLKTDHNKKNWKAIQKELEVVKFNLKKKKTEPFIKKANANYMICHVPTELPKDLKKKLGDECLKKLSVYYARFCNYCEKEENYNRKYLFDVYNKGEVFKVEQGHLVFDQIYPSDQQKIELFDIAFYSPDELFLYHVKKQMGQMTRDACSQIRTAAGSLSNALSIAGKSDILCKLFDHIIESESTSDFPKKVKEQLVSFGKTVKEQKENFLKIFRRDKKQISFVYAFLDDAVHERDLGAELQRSYAIKSTEFGEQCTLYKGKDPLTGEEILNQLRDEGFIDASDRISDQFIGLNKADDFSPSFLQGRKKNSDAIFKILQSHLSQYKSFIAKKELLDTKQVIEGLGFNFRICQIYRDGKPSASLYFKKDEYSQLNDDQINNWENVIEYNGQAYLILPTAGGGACALHALNGVEHKDQITFCHDQLDPHCAAKKDFIAKLEYKLNKGNDVIKTLLINLFSNFLKEYWKKNMKNEPKLLYQSIKLNLPALKKEKDTKTNNRRNLLLNRATEFWSYFKQQKKGNWKEKYLDILRSYKQTEWATLKNEELIEKIEANLVATIDGCWDNLYNIMGSYGKKKLDPIQCEIDILTNKIVGLESQFVRQHFDSIWGKYASVLIDNSYYLSEQEIELASIVYDKKNVKIIGQAGRYDLVTSQPDSFNPDEGEPDCLIYSHGNHYSQCRLCS